MDKLFPAVERTYKDPYGFTYGALDINAKQGEGKAVWSVDRPFRLNSIVFFGYDHLTTLKGVYFNYENDLLQPLSIVEAFPNNWVLENVLEFLDAIPNRTSFGVNIKKRFYVPGYKLHFSTLSQGGRLAIEWEGKLDHVLMIGSAIDG